MYMSKRANGGALEVSWPAGQLTYLANGIHSGIVPDVPLATDAPEASNNETRAPRYDVRIGQAGSPAAPARSCAALTRARAACSLVNQGPQARIKDREVLKVLVF
jgi:hypothetical protein